MQCRSMNFSYSKLRVAMSGGQYLNEYDEEMMNSDDEIEEDEEVEEEEGMYVKLW